MSKEEAIEILNQYDVNFEPCPPEDVVVAIDMAIEALESTRWIPVSERLPKQDKYVFVYLFGDNPYIAWHDGIDWCTDEFVLDTDEEPLEWMSLPKRYRGESDDEV